MMQREVWRPTCYEYRTRAPREKLHTRGDGDEPGAETGAVSKPAGKRAKAARGASEKRMALEKVS